MLNAADKKLVRKWAKENNIDLSWNKKLDLPQSTAATAIERIKEVLSILTDRLAAEKAMDGNHIPYDNCSYLGNENGLELLSYNGKEFWANFSKLTYINGYLAVPKHLLN